MKRLTDAHYRAIARVLWMTLACNWLVSGAKIAYGLSTKAFSMTADGVHSLMDGMNNIVGLISVYYAAQPADKEHQYGHQKFETIAALGICFVLFLACYELIKRAALRLLDPALPVPDVNQSGFWIMGAGILINIGVSLYERKRGRELKSQLLLADAMHTQTDIAVSVSVLLSLVALSFGLPRVDTLIAIAIALYIAYAALGILKQNVDILADAAPISTDSVETIVLQVPGVKSCHKIRARGPAGNIFVDLHVQIAPETDTRQSHHIVHQVANAIKERIDGVKDVIIHTEPYDPVKHGPHAAG